MRSAGAIPVIVLSAILAVPSLAMACTCHWGGPIAKVALGQKLIVYGEVLDYYKHSMEVKVLEVLKGKKRRGARYAFGGITGPFADHMCAAFPSALGGSLRSLHSRRTWGRISPFHSGTDSSPGHPRETMQFRSVVTSGWPSRVKGQLGGSPLLSTLRFLSGFLSARSFRGFG